MNLINLLYTANFITDFFNDLFNEVVDGGNAVVRVAGLLVFFAGIVVLIWAIYKARDNQPYGRSVLVGIACVVIGGAVAASSDIYNSLMGGDSGASKIIDDFSELGQ